MEKSKTEEPRKLAVYASPYGGGIVLEGCKDDASDGYARVSEFVAVCFPALPADEIVASRVSAIDSEINEARDKFAAKLAELQERRQNLLALTAPVDDAAEIASRGF